MSTQIQIRRDTTANWESVNPVLADGEIGYDTTANKFKVGNGTDAWRDIEYSSSDVEEAPDDGAQYARQSVNSNMTWTPVVGGSMVHVDPNPPANPQTGQLWFDTDGGELNLFDGNDWIVIGSGSKAVFTLPVFLRSGLVQLPVSDDADSLPVFLRSGDSSIPLNQSGDILPATTRSGEIELPLAS